VHRGAQNLCEGWKARVWPGPSIGREGPLN
jgi:hypothetical protein